MESVECRWNEFDHVWNEADFTWEEACSIASQIVGGGYTSQLTRLRKQKKPNQKKFIKLLCFIKDEEYEESKYFNPNVSVTANDFRIVEKELKKIKLNVFINK
jgi:hypothetical protein